MAGAIARRAAEIRATVPDLELAIDVVAEDTRSSAGLIDQRGDDANQCRLAGTIRPEQREEIALLDIQIHARERLHPVAVHLGQAADCQCLHGSGPERRAHARAAR